jgi:Zn-dependent protease with chaperone function
MAPPLSDSRENETEADGFAIALMRKNGISTLPMADLHERLARHGEDAERWKGQSDWLRDAARFMASHPGPAERAARLRAAAPDATPPGDNL